MVEISSLLLLIGFALLFYKWTTQNNDYFKKRGLSYQNPTFIFGNTAAFFFKKIGIIEFVEYLYEACPKEKISGFFNFMTPIYLVRDPEIFKEISVKEFDSFEDHKFIIDNEVDSLLGNTVFLMRGKKWREMRATLSPAFTGSKMRLMFELIRECSVNTVNYFRDLNPDRKVMSIEMRDFFARCSNDIIASCAFGVDINSFKDKDNVFLKAGQRITELTSLKSVIKFVTQRIAPSLMKFLRIEFLDADLRKFFTNMVLQNMAARRANGIIRPDMIDILMKTKSAAVMSSHAEESIMGTAAANRKWTDAELISQCFVFYLGGLDTITQVLVAATYELILHPEIQQKLFEEIDINEKQLKGDKTSYEGVHKLMYMDMVISEVLRLRPPAVFLDRLCTKDFNLKLEGRVVQIEKGSQLWIPVHCYHRDPIFYPHPDRFDPERFNEENRTKINPAYYIPFGNGPRQCIASRFALMEVKTTLYYLLKDYKMEVNEHTQIPMKMKTTPFSMYPEKGLHVNLIPRY